VQRLLDPHQFDLHPTGPGDVLDLGCGSAKTPGAFGVDISADTDADLVHDLDNVPYPIADASFDQIILQDVIEHVDKPYEIMAELHRLARPGARIQMRTPHFSSVLAYSDATHRHHFSALGVRALAEPRFSHYTAARFRVVHVTLDLWAPYRVLGLGHLAARFPVAYEKYFAQVITAMNVRAEFEVLK